jgi:hypothetical protein
MLFVERAELEERRGAVTDGARAGGLDERKLLDVAEPERRHLQNDARQVRPHDLRRGERRARREVLFGVKANAYAGARAPRAARALLRRGLRYFLDREPLDLASRIVAAHAREPGVDHVTHPGHGERRLGDVGREDDAPPRMRAKDARLLSRRKTRVERQDFRFLGVNLAQRFGRLADGLFAREKDEHVARSRRELAYRVDERRQNCVFFRLGDAFVVRRGDERGAVARFDGVHAP